ncbi:MAG: flagellar hook-basal body complex protein [Opitutaceae bacterium]|nr:flagellar hook-basal body complex protein [Opitutaceae bacterium]
MSLIGTLTSGVSALKSFTQGLEVIGNNIANVNTTGFKSSKATFADSFSNTLRGSAPSNGSTSNQAPLQVGTGVQISGITANFGQGALTSTGNTTDLAISGGGFFIVKDAASGQQYATRDGEFRIDDQGYLVNPQGYRVQGLTGGTPAAPLSATNTGAIGDIRIGQNLPAATGTPPVQPKLQSISIDTAGNVIESYSDGSSATTNRVQLQNFSDPTALTKEGNSLYAGFEAAGPLNGGTTPGGSVLSGATAGANNPGTNGLGAIQSGQLELSNVDLTEQFADMITTQRSFQASSRLVTVSDTILEDIVNLKRS